MLGQYKGRQIIASVWSSIGRRRFVQYQLTTHLWSVCRMIILSLYFTYYGLTKKSFWYFAHLSFAYKKRHFRWYWYIVLKYRGNVPSYIYLMLYNSEIFSIVQVNSCEFFWFTTLVIMINDLLIYFSFPGYIQYMGCIFLVSFYNTVHSNYWSF